LSHRALRLHRKRFRNGGGASSGAGALKVPAISISTVVVSRISGVASVGEVAGLDTPMYAMVARLNPREAVSRVVVFMDRIEVCSD